MFDLKRFVVDGLLNAIGKQADYQVIFNALGWQQRGVLDDADLSKIQQQIDAKNYIPPDPEISPEQAEQERVSV